VDGRLDGLVSPGRADIDRLCRRRYRTDHYECRRD
jgi:hypothetical protein